MPFTIYFSGSITGGREDAPLYKRIVDYLTSRGHRVLAGSVAEQHLGKEGEALEPKVIFERDMSWIAECARDGGLLIAEVSKPSSGVGYEIAAARYLHKMPVICLWRRIHTPRCSAMIAGDSGIRLIVYDELFMRHLFRDLDAVLAELAGASAAG